MAFNKIFTNCFDYSKAISKSLVCLMIFFFLNQSTKAQDFYEISKIQEIKLYFTQSNWNTLLVTAAQAPDEPYTFCSRVIINGVTFDSVGAKYKGNSTFNATRKKNPWHIELDHYKPQNYQGIKDIKLANIFQDPSCVREALSYELMQPYTDLPRANYAKVWVNDTLIGLYTNTEAVTKSFCKKYFSSGNMNTFVKCTPPVLKTGGASSLAYLGADSTQYYISYEIKSDYGWKQLIDLCDTLNNKTTEVEKILDVDRTLWMLAFNILFANLDSYTGGFTQNYYLWRDENLRFNPIIWDLNMSFGGFAGPGQPTDTLAFAKIDPFRHLTNASKPLISKLLSNSRYSKMYIAHLRTMLNEAFKSGKYKTRGEAMRSIIDAAVQSDINNLSTYALFKTNFYYASSSSGDPGGGVSVPGIVSLVESKIKYLDTLAVMKYVTPSISEVKGTSTKMGATAWITAKVSGNMTNGVLIGYRNNVTDVFKRVGMYDDGQHQDGAANDGVFGIDVKMTTSFIEYYIWAENANAGIFSPERAEHEFYRLNSTFTATSDVVINEVMASNTRTAADNKGEYDDWIELYNKSNAAINIGGWYISDNTAKLKKWTIPANTSIPANGYVIIWADEDSSQNTATSFHANFKLSSAGETIILSMPDTTIVDQVTFGTQGTDYVFARRPNGIGAFVIQTPTFNASNNTGTTATEEIISSSALKIYPNPASTEGGVTIELDYEKTVRLQIFNMLGQVFYDKNMTAQEQVETRNWQAGIYIVKVGNISQKLIIK